MLKSTPGKNAMPKGPGNSLVTWPFNAIVSTFTVSVLPAADRIRILNNEDNDRIFVYDISGRLRYEGVTDEIEVTDLENGMYFLHIKNNGKMSTARFTVLH